MLRLALKAKDGELDKAIEGLENKDGENKAALDAEIAALKKADEDNKNGVDAEVVGLRKKTESWTRQ